MVAMERVVDSLNVLNPEKLLRTAVFIVLV